MNGQIVGVLVGGLIALVSVLAGIFASEAFQRRRDAITRARLMADNKRASLTGRYTATLLAARQLFDEAHVFASKRVARKDVAGPLGAAFIAAYTPLMLESDQGDVIERCAALASEFRALMDHFPPPDDLDIGPFDRAFVNLTKMLAARKAELDKIP